MLFFFNKTQPWVIDASLAIEDVILNRYFSCARYFSCVKM